MSAQADRRSVGELLLEAEQQVRDLLHEAPERSGLGMARGWVEVIGAAHELWRALPTDEGADPTWGDRQRPADLMDQLQQSAASVQKRIERAATGAGRFSAPVDDTLVDLAGQLFRAGDLVQTYRGRSTSARMPQDVAADVDAARARIMHALYLTSHAVTVALTDDLHSLGREPNFPRNAVLDAQRRIGSSEQLAGTYVQKTYPVALDGEHREPLQRDRFADALSAWDVAAHRALANSPSAATLWTVTSQEMVTTGHMQLLWRIAAERGHIHQNQYRTRLAPALENLQRAWDRNTRVWEALTPRTGAPAPQELRAAATELRAATRELTHDRTAPAHGQLVAARTDLVVLVPTLQHSLSTSVELAHAFRDTRAVFKAIQVAPKPAMAMQNERLQSMPFPNMRWASQEQARTEGGVPLRALNQPSTPLPTVLVPTMRRLGDATVRAAARTMGTATGIEGKGRTRAEAPQQASSEPAPTTTTARMARWRTAMATARALEGPAR
ncbi:hypothetical protein [Ornithinimicrobium murale]|uniref:hypothetical protein n=1 Tax=Ornithinimicrobium murale TaxID=1050153 RepID=UPI000E0D4E49|nr:hypothetical protein [Ornithinimicrobium murale]